MNGGQPGPVRWIPASKAYWVPRPPTPLTSGCHLAHLADNRARRARGKDAVRARTACTSLLAIGASRDASRSSRRRKIGAYVAHQHPRASQAASS
eukprot:scaffold6525_cov26-Tisochrysis_lutea.AAC.1